MKAKGKPLAPGVVWHRERASALSRESPLPRRGRAAVMTVPGAPLALREYPLPAPGEGDLLVRVTCCTLCGSDLHTWSGRRPAPPAALLGHEIVGVVAAVGAGGRVDTKGRALEVGDRVTWTLHSCCGACVNCAERGLPMKCVALRKFGHGSAAPPPHFTGGLADYCLVDVGAGVVRLPDTLTDRAAAPANCATATAVAACEAAGVGAGAAILIQGAGALGCYAAAYASWRGARRVVVADPDRVRLARAERFGATHILDVAGMSETEVAEAAAALSSGDGFDAALELAGTPTAIPAGLAALRVGGVYVECGCVFPGAEARLDVSRLVQRMLTVRGVHNYALDHLVTAIDFLDGTRDRFDWESVVTETYPLARATEALEAAASGRGLRVAVFPSE